VQQRVHVDRDDVRRRDLLEGGVQGVGLARLPLGDDHEVDAGLGSRLPGAFHCVVRRAVVRQEDRNRAGIIGVRHRRDRGADAGLLVARDGSLCLLRLLGCREFAAPSVPLRATSTRSAAPGTRRSSR
jgi:hypothetical protein